MQGVCQRFWAKKFSGGRFLCRFRRGGKDLVVRVQDQQFLRRFGGRNFAVLQQGDAVVKGAILSIQGQQQVLAGGDILAQPAAQGFPIPQVGVILGVKVVS